MIQVPSIQFLFESLRSTIRRFPLPCLSALIGTIAAILLIWAEAKEYEDIFTKILLSAQLGVPLLCAVRLFTEYQLHSVQLNKLLIFFFPLIIIVYGFSINEELLVSDIFNHSVYTIVAHLMVSFTPFLVLGTTQQFWVFNKTLFLRILLSLLYSGALFIGLTLAIGSLDILFGVDVDSKYYGYLAVLVLGLFNTIHFLSGVPEDFSYDDPAESYPKALRFFVMFVLLPLVAIYGVILYAYTLKIIINWNLPNGWVSNLILGFSVLGILSYLLAFPLKSITQNSWVKIFAQWFFFLLLPMVALLFLAFFVRVQAYGVTENRYVLFLIGVVLVLLSFYFILRKNASIKAIPIMLVIAGLVATFGPFNASKMAFESQKDRFLKLIDDHNLEIPLNRADISTKSLEVKNGLTGSLLFFAERGHLDQFQSEIPSFAYFANHSVYNGYELLDSLGLSRWNVYPSNEGEQRFNFRISTNTLLNIEGYDRMIEINAYHSNHINADVSREKSDLQFIYSEDAFFLEIDWTENKLYAVREQDTIYMGLGAFMADLTNKYSTENYGNLTAEELTLISEDGSFKILFDSMQIISADGRLECNDFFGKLLWRFDQNGQ
ncbi:MAG: DUF4153 domain-containing protein [Bacteroidota bacterium]